MSPHLFMNIVPQLEVTIPSGKHAEEVSQSSSLEMGAWWCQEHC